MNKLEHKSNVLENDNIETALKDKKENKFISILKMLKNIFSKNSNDKNFDEDKK